jgi:hypothetical protein
MPSWEDYDGKFSRLIGTFAGKLERKSVHAPHYKPGAVLCTLEAKNKFFLFVQDTVDPGTILGAGFNAGIGQAEDSEFIKDFAYPLIFKEDSRYYRLIHGGTGKRLLHAIDHAFVAHREDGTRMFNITQWLGTASSAVLSNTYHPDNKRGVAPLASRVVFSVLNGMGYDVLREFWPDISRKLKLPFRGQNVIETPDPDLRPVKVP